MSWERRQYEAGRTLRDIAKELGIAHGTLAEDLKREGVTLRPRGRPRKTKTTP